MNNKNNWKERFEKAWFKWEIEEDNCSWSSVDSDNLKKFFTKYLQSELDKQREEIIEEIKVLAQETLEGNDNDHYFFRDLEDLIKHKELN